MITIGKAITA